MTPPLADFDRRTAKKIGKGTIDIEARIDLHGQRLDDAYVALRRFLFRCHNDDKRIVLVVTGKGRETSDPYAPFDMAPNVAAAASFANPCRAGLKNPTYVRSSSVTPPPAHATAATARSMCGCARENERRERLFPEPVEVQPVPAVGQQPHAAERRSQRTERRRPAITHRIMI